MGLLPNVSISFEDGNLGFQPENTDGLVGLIVTGTPQGTVTVSTAYRITRLKDLDELGVTIATNPLLVRFVQDFYNNAQEGTPMWFMIWASVVSAYGANKATTTKLIRATNNQVTALFVLGAVGTFADVTAFTTFAVSASTYRNEVLASDNTPVIHVIDFIDYDSTVTLTPIITAKGVAGFIGKDSAGKSSIGVLAGRYATNSIQRNIGAVADGGLVVQGGEQYHDEILVKQMDKAVNINDARFISLRVHNNRTGFYFIDDPMFAPDTSDYRSLTAQRTIDKAYRIAFYLLTGKLLTQLAVTATGAIQAHEAKAIEDEIRKEIKLQMTDKGQLNSDFNDPSDAGVMVGIDTAYNTQVNSKIKLNYLRVKPFGYARFFDVPLGFVPISQ